MHFNFTIKNINICDSKFIFSGLKLYKKIIDLNYLIFLFFKITKKTIKLLYEIFKKIKINWFNINKTYILEKKKHELPYKIYIYKTRKITIIKMGILYNLKIFNVFHYYKILYNIYSLTIKKFFFIFLITKYLLNSPKNLFKKILNKFIRRVF